MFQLISPIFVVRNHFFLWHAHLIKCWFVACCKIAKEKVNVQLQVVFIAFLSRVFYSVLCLCLSLRPSYYVCWYPLHVFQSLLLNPPKNDFPPIFLVFLQLCFCPWICLYDILFLFVMTLFFLSFFPEYFYFFPEDFSFPAQTLTQAALKPETETGIPPPWEDFFCTIVAADAL